jgi:hypothetical protein
MNKVTILIRLPFPELIAYAKGEVKILEKIGRDY